MYYKISKPINTFYLDVDNENKIYVKQYGNKNGIPIFYIHGGPGGYTTNKITKYFNLKYFNVVSIDQRGCGKSIPNLVIKNNNTNNLILDIEKVRIYLNMKKIIVYGGSWGATLSILYALKYPKNIITYIVSSGYYYTDNHIFPNSVITMFPEKWYKFCKKVNIPNSSIFNSSFKIQKEICKRYYDKIKNNNKSYINEWFNFENSLIYTNKIQKDITIDSIDSKIIQIALYESYYYYKNLFIEKDHIIKNCHKIKNIKGYIIHGRIDVICEYKESYLLHKKLPKSILISVDNEGHSGKIQNIKINEILKKIKDKYYSKSNSFYYKY